MNTVETMPATLGDVCTFFALFCAGGSVLPKKRQQEIRALARRVQNEMWRQRAQIWSKPPAQPEFMIPVPVKDAITRHLGLTFEEPDLIPADVGGPAASPFAEIAGLVDRSKRLIMIALRFPMDQRRFTAAHELGHWLMHKELILHRSVILRRDRILAGPDRSIKRPRIEQEADLFAAEFLMPSRMVQREFFARFTRPIGATSADEELAFALSSKERRLNSYDLADLAPGKLASLVANAVSYRGNSFMSLRERFRVSAGAMGIQLTDLGLVH